MALALHSATPLASETLLSQSISEFERVLSSKEQKSSFRNFRSQALRSAPRPEDAMRFTAELSTAQQYAAIGDVIVGASQNILAAGIWSLVRLSLQMAVGLTSHVEKISTFFMEAGRDSPRYQSMTLIYPRSASLRGALCHYFTTVTRVCRRLRRLGDSTIFANNGVYGKWKSDGNPSMLVLMGKLGSGKSVAMTNVIDDLHLLGDGSATVYFFCRHDVPEGLASRTILGCLFWQILQGCIKKSPIAEECPMQSLSEEESDKAVKAARKDLPQDLYETYEWILTRARRGRKDYQSSILKLVSSASPASRPLIMLDLQEALSVTPHHPEWHKDRLINDIRRAITCCGSLVSTNGTGFGASRK
ncbi:hypothetical protein B0H67DRAFT_684565 [Lasiosphaeris hirsuta]|uniref:Nephrocystin 3-like N-terminal domain-containing protein n=1 Tax=Lasiosphaeris hirsuta TaxID=260670 RepID=A0AA40A7X2_9PEZI|nr:hypothetical protein B0H67DRAFT_684565 [Lasiosphaeris hirsuta]